MYSAEELDRFRQDPAAAEEELKTLIAERDRLVARQQEEKAKVASLHRKYLRTRRWQRFSEHSATAFLYLAYGLVALTVFLALAGVAGSKIAGVACMAIASAAIYRLAEERANFFLRRMKENNNALEELVRSYGSQD